MMSRRDAILVAVLINAGLLVILFATAVTTDKDELPQVRVNAPSPPLVVETPRPTSGGDEIDQVLSRYKPTLTLPAEPVKAPILEAPKSNQVEITVKKGDSLDKIARQNGTTIAALMQANGLTDSRLQIGQALRVPTAKEAKPVPKEEEAFYTVRSGDNPWTLATKLEIPVDELLRINNLDEERARRLKPGDRIRVK